MDNVVPIHRDAHREALRLLPWFVSGALADEEKALVEAHLAACAECRAELALERRLAGEVAALPSEAEPAWAAMAQRLDAPARPRTKARKGHGFHAAQALRIARTAPPWLGWAVAAQILLLIGVRALTLSPTPVPANPVYHALASPAGRPAANIAVIFRPRTTEADVRRILEASHARVADGPTVAGAWLLTTPPGGRVLALQSLQRSSAVLTAEPIDPVEP